MPVPDWCEENARHILLLFVSPVSPQSMKKPPRYRIFGKEYTCVQTNESAIIYCREMMGGRKPDKIFLIVSQMVQEEGDTPYGRMTHLAYLERRIQEIYGDADIGKRIEIQAYGDTLKDMDKAVMDLSDIAGKMARFSKAHAGETIYLHADMTGGFRHASMMMLSIMQLTSFLGIHIGQVLYSEPKQESVYVANKIHAMFDLISGVEEFVQFGSIHTLQRYFERSAESQSTELLNLLTAMKNFSDGIRLCRTDAIRPIMADLRKRIEIFEGSGGKSSEEHIFLQLLQRVKEEYALVTQADASELDVIRWCMKKGHWQQAMTFATERLPIYIVDHHICEPVEGSGYEKKGDTSHHHWQQCFIVNARVPMPKVQKAQKKAKENLYLFFREALQGNRMQVEEDLKTLELLPEKFYQMVNEIENADALLAEVRTHIGGFMNTPLRVSMLNRLYPAEFMQKHCMFSRLLKFLYFSLGGDNMSYLHFLYKNVSRESILRGLLNCKMERCVEHDEIYLLVRLLQSEKEKRLPNSEKAERSQEEKWQEREAYWREAFARGVVRTKYPKKWEQVIHLLRAFERLRNERNRINHANDEQVEAPSMDVKLVEGMLNDCLEAIQDILPSSAPVRAL